MIPIAIESQRQIRLSHSTLETLHTCERKFQLEKLLDNGAPREESEHFSFGHAVGKGIASYMSYQDADLALFEAWHDYWPEIETEKKNQWKAMNALLVAFNKLDDFLQDYEVVSFDGKPATELGFRLDIDETYYFVGYVDVVVRNKWSGQYCIFEVKHTGLELHDLDPLYKNSGQALGYSIALDKIVGEQLSDYGVIYFVLQLGKGYTPKAHVLHYDKTLLDRLNWFLSLGLDVEGLKRMAELNVYPKRGGSCLNFMKPCPHFGVCGLHGMDRPAPIVPDEKHYDFSYDLDSLVEEHLVRLASPEHQHHAASPDNPFSAVSDILEEI